MLFEYLSPAVLKGFDSYKYSSVDNSPLSKYITHPFWNFTVQFFPLWLAPNLMTFCGFMCLVVDYGVVACYDWDFSAPDRMLKGEYVVPSWVWLCCGLGTFIGHTLDGCDGKQARRTKSSTPLGELFDHGLDSWATMILPTTMYSVFGRGEWGASVEAYYWVIMFVMISFILCHWEKYNTGILFLPWTYDMSQVGMTVVFLSAYLFGIDWLKTRVSIIGITIATLGIVFFAVSLVFLAFMASFINVYKAYTEKTGNMLPFVECIRPMVPCLLWFTLTTVWVYLSPNQILLKQPRLVYALMGAVFSNITCRLIVNQMSKTRCDGFNLLIVPLMVLLPLIVFVPSMGEQEDKILLVYTVIAILAHIHYGVSVVQQMANKFNICVFSLDKPSLHNGTVSKTE